MTPRLANDIRKTQKSITAAASFHLNDLNRHSIGSPIVAGGWQRVGLQKVVQQSVREFDVLDPRARPTFQRLTVARPGGRVLVHGERIFPEAGEAARVAINATGVSSTALLESIVLTPHFLTNLRKVALTLSVT